MKTDARIAQEIDVLRTLLADPAFQEALDRLAGDVMELCRAFLLAQMAHIAKHVEPGDQVDAVIAMVNGWMLGVPAEKAPVSDARHKEIVLGRLGVAGFAAVEASEAYAAQRRREVH